MKLLILGCGDVGKFIATNFDEFGLSDFELEGFLDDDIEKWGEFICGLPVLGPVSQLLGRTEETAVVIGIADPKVRKYLVREYFSDIISSPNLIAKNTWISKGVSLGKGVIIYPGTQINYETAIDDFVIINMNCAIGHNNIISKYSTLSPGVSLGGFTQIGEGVTMGINTATRQSINIGSDSIIGGMSMVIKNIPENVTAVGIPARVIKQNEKILR